MSQPIHDADSLLSCGLMNVGDVECTLTPDERYGLFPIGDAPPSILFELYDTTVCGNCKKVVGTRYHCTDCDDFDLCTVCKEEVGHPHKMEKLVFDEENDSPSVVPTPTALTGPGAGHVVSPGTVPFTGSGVPDMAPVQPSNPSQVEAVGGGISPLTVTAPTPVSSADPEQSEAERRQYIQQGVQTFQHASQCRDTNCRFPNCQIMKNSVKHAHHCAQKATGGCPTCKHVVTLFIIHCTSCQDRACPILVCRKIKYRLYQKQLQKKLQQTTAQPGPGAGPIVGPGAAVPGVEEPGVARGQPSIHSQAEDVNSLADEGSRLTLTVHSPVSGHIGGMTTPFPIHVQAEATRQQVSIGGGFGGSHLMMLIQLQSNILQRQANPGGMVGSVGNVVGVGSISSMAAGGIRQQSNTNSDMQPPNQNQVMQYSAMQQQNMQSIVGSGGSTQAVFRNANRADSLPQLEVETQEKISNKNDCKK